MRTGYRAVKLTGEVLGAVGVGILLLISASEFQGYFWTRDYARARALQRVSETCLRDGGNPALLTLGQEETGSGKTVWLFEWTYQGRPRRLHGAWIFRDGHIELFAGDPDDPSDAAYEPGDRSTKPPPRGLGVNTGI